MTTAIKTETDVLSENLDIIFSNRGMRVFEKLQLAEMSILSLKKEMVYDFGFEPTRCPETFGKRHLLSHLFIKKILPYGFEMVALTYDYNEEYREFVINRVYELDYNLRDKVTMVKKNGKEYKFSRNNISAMFSGYDAVEIMKTLDQQTDMTFYMDMWGAIGKIGMEGLSDAARFLTRLMTYNKAELIYKSGVPVRFAVAFAKDITQYSVPDGCGDGETCKPKAAGLLDLEATTPTGVLGVPRGLFNLIKAGVVTYEIYTRVSRHWENAVKNYGTNKNYSNNPELKKDKVKRLADNEVICRRNHSAWVRASSTMWNLYQHTVEFDKKYGMYKSRAIFNIEFADAVWSILAPQKVTEFTKTSCVSMSVSTGADLKTMIEFAYYRLPVEQGYDAYALSDEELFGASPNKMYRDYLQMRDQMGARKNYYPKYLATQHAIIAKNLEVTRDPKIIDKFKIHVSACTLDQVQIPGKYQMVLPKDVSDLAAEGASLSHCVASYARRVAAGTSIIMFMRERKALDTSFITVEVEPRMQTRVISETEFEEVSIPCVSQASGFDNRELTYEEGEYLTKWAKAAGVEMVGQVELIDHTFI